MMLLALYRESDGDSEAIVPFGALAGKYGIKVEKPFWIRDLKTEWSQVGWARFPEDGTGRAENVGINLQGVRQAEALDSNLLPMGSNPLGPNDVVLHAVPAQADIRITGSAETEFVPASDRIVNFDDNRPVVEKAEQALLPVVQAISDSNTLLPDQKGLILSSIEAGIGLLKRPKAYIAAISALLLEPLYEAYASVIEEVSKPLIQHAIDAVRQLIGI
jgi:hypothetical protein